MKCQTPFSGKNMSCKLSPQEIICMKCQNPDFWEKYMSCKLSPWETVCMKCQTPISGKNMSCKLSPWETVCMKCRTPISGENMSCKLSPWEIICMKCQTPFSGKNKNISKCAEIFTWHATHFLFRYARKQTGSHRSCLPLSQMAMCPAKI